MKQLKLYGRSLRRHPGWRITVIYMGMPAVYELIHNNGDYRWNRVLLGTAAMSIVTLIPVLWTAWYSRDA